MDRRARGMAKSSDDGWQPEPGWAERARPAPRGGVPFDWDAEDRKDPQTVGEEDFTRDFGQDASDGGQRATGTETYQADDTTYRVDHGGGEQCRVISTNGRMPR